MEDLISSSSTLHSNEYQNETQFADEFDFKLHLFSPDQLKYEEIEEYHHSQQGDDDDKDNKDEDIYEVEVDEDDEDDFSFVITGPDTSSFPGEDGQIRPIFPLFNQDLLLAHEDYKISDKRLPHRPPVNKVFIETPPSTSSPSDKTDEIDGTAAGPYCEFRPELSKKSNSTGFSKLWRFKEYMHHMHRSHSDGRDAFVFLNSSDQTKKGVKFVRKDISSSEKKIAGEVKVDGDGERKVVRKVKKTVPLSPHEVYLRSKGYHPEEDKRKSYLTYKPELVGFFTNVNGGGLTKNVHPY